MKKNEKSVKPSAEVKSQASEIKIHRDFNDFGRIVSENLNEFFDVDFMAAARRRELRRRK